MENKCYCQRIITSPRPYKHNANQNEIILGRSNGDRWVSAYLYLDYNINNHKYGLFAEATGEEADGVYVRIHYCPFCGRNLDTIKEEKED